jgi:hypothetical protein
VSNAQNQYCFNTIGVHILKKYSSYFAHVKEPRNICYIVKSKLLLCLQTTDLSVFETNIRFVGGLLTCFALTGDVIFRDKAEQVARKLLPAFQTQTGIPHSLINIKTGVKHFIHSSHQGTVHVYIEILFN